jgi:hypothetical protein
MDKNSDKERVSLIAIAIYRKGCKTKIIKLKKAKT